MNASREMPKYECHKKVWALKIAGIVGDIHGGVYFQPAEEGTRGARAMVAAGALDDVDYFTAIHIGTGVPAGTVICGSDNFMATTKFDVNFTGVAAHAGGKPEDGRNALLAAAQAALALHSIAPHSEGASRVNVGVMQAGSGRNVVPEIRPAMQLEAWCAEQDEGLKLNLHPRASASINTLPLPVERIRLLIGPEGGLSAEEIAMTAQYQFTDILLGPRVLRTETTALTAITALQVRFGDLG